MSSLLPLDLARLLQNHDLLGAWWQSEAARKAGKLALQGATRQSIAAIFSSGLALLAGLFVLGAARWQVGAAREQERLTTASALAGDIDALQAFLRGGDVVDALRDHARSQTRYYFHPGESWLQVYFDSPARVGLFKQDTARALASYHSRMRGELGRLVWMHELKDEKLKLQPQDWLASEQTTSADNLATLFGVGDALLDKLGNECRAAEHRLRSVWRLVLNPAQP